MIYYSSVDVSKELNISHNCLLEKIRKIISNYPEHEKHFKISQYTNKRNRNYPCYQLTGKARKMMIATKTIGISSKTIELNYLEIIKTLMPYENVIFQKRILGKYFVDMYIERINMCIEIYEEKGHKFKKEQDKKRKNEIIKELSKEGKVVYFIEIWEKQLATGLSEIIKILENNEYKFYKEN